MNAQDSDTQLKFDLNTSEEADKEAKLQDEQEKILRSVASAKLDTLQERVAWILNHYLAARDSDITLQLIYCGSFSTRISTTRASSNLMIFTGSRD